MVGYPPPPLTPPGPGRVGSSTEATGPRVCAMGSKSTVSNGVWVLQFPMVRGFTGLLEFFTNGVWVCDLQFPMVCGSTGLLELVIGRTAANAPVWRRGRVLQRPPCERAAVYY